MRIMQLTVRFTLTAYINFNELNRNLYFFCRKWLVFDANIQWMLHREARFTIFQYILELFEATSRRIELLILFSQIDFC